MEWKLLTDCCRGALPHFVGMLAASGLALVGAAVLRAWRDRIYGTPVTVVVTWLEPKVHSDSTQHLMRQIIWEGRVDALLLDRGAVQRLVQAYRRSRWDGVDAPLQWNSWTYDAECTLNLIGHKLAMSFAQGALARAMHDKDVTMQAFLIGAFRGIGGAIVIQLITQDDVERCQQQDARIEPKVDTLALEMGGVVHRGEAGGVCLYM